VCREAAQRDRRGADEEAKYEESDDSTRRRSTGGLPAPTVDIEYPPRYYARLRRLQRESMVEADEIERLWVAFISTILLE
jgi:hypothetical protein